MVKGEAAGDLILGMVGVLIFVDEQVAIATGQFAANVRLIAEQESGPYQQVVEIKRVILFENSLVRGVNFR